MSGTGIVAITSALAEHAAAERVSAEDRLGEDVVDAVLRLVLVHRDLLEHDLALGVDVGVGRRRAASPPSRSKTSSVCSSRKRACRCVVSLPVAALIEAPSPSKRSEISIAE